MTLLLNEEQQQLKDSAKSFVDDQWQLNQLRLNRATPKAGTINTELWQQMVELGWAAIPFPEEFGGLGLGYAELGIVMEEAGRKLLISPLLSSVVLSGSAIELAGSVDQKTEHLPKICDGSGLYAMAYQETSRHEPNNVHAALTKSDGGYQLTGHKQLVINGGSADQLVVVCRSSGDAGDRDGLSLVLVDSAAAGVSIANNLLLDSTPSANITFKNVQISPEHILGEVGNAAEVLDEVYARAAIALSADMLGGIQSAFDMTLEYLKVREQFGAKIGSFQGLKHRAGRWFCEVELSKSIVLKALRSIDSGSGDLGRISNACKARCTDTYQLSGKEGIQMHGGIGVTDEHDIGLYFKRARVTEIVLGDASFHADQFATTSGY
ncbi:MAG: alkylation response protein AidB-like acyl-CoA dehydrogenase [Candidatus Azotimanducaceae bacterium]|jgi:alkylation response protein AidB-like acyl-CoA dehydrogenase